MTILDQIEVETSYSGSYTTDIIVGNVFSSYSPTVNSNRALIATTVHRHKASAFTTRNWLYSDFLNYYSASYIGGSARYLGLTTEGEFLYDSFGPNIVDTYNMDSYPCLATASLRGALELGVVPYDSPTTKIGGAGMILRLSTPAAAAAAEIANGGDGSFHNTRWPAAFPFETRYRSVSRTLKYGTVEPKLYDLSRLETGAAITWVGAAPHSSSNDLVMIRFCGTNTRYASVMDLPMSPTSSYPRGGSAVTKREERMRMSPRSRNLAFYGFGDGQRAFSNSGDDNYLWPGLSNSPGYLDFVTYIQPSGNIERITAGVTTRGAKYGMYSCIPIQTKAIFRNNKFGNLRDMLEQRPFSTFAASENNKPLAKVQGVVTYTFKSGSTIAAQALDYLTASAPTYNPRDSGQFDIEYRSGKPYFDL